MENRIKELYDEIDAMPLESRNKIKKLLRMAEDTPFRVTKIKKKIDALIQVNEKEEKEHSKRMSFLWIGGPILFFIAHFFYPEEAKIGFIFIIAIGVFLVSGNYVNNLIFNSRLSSEENEQSRYENEWIIAGLSSELLSDSCVRIFAREREDFSSITDASTAFKQMELDSYQKHRVKMLTECIKATDGNVAKWGLTV